MKEQKKFQLKRSLEYAQRELEDLKRNHPEGNYELLERTIQQLEKVLDGEESSYRVGRVLLRFFLYIVISYCFVTMSVAVIFGLENFLMQPREPATFITIIPLVGLVVFLFLKLINFLSSLDRVENPIFFTIILLGIGMIGFAILDQSFVHICKSFSDSLFMCISLLILAIGIDYYLCEKIYFGI